MYNIIKIFLLLLLIKEIYIAIEKDKLNNDNNNKINSYIYNNYI